MLLSKELGASELGLYTLVFTIYMLGMQSASFGVSLALTKYISEYIDDINKVKEFISTGLIISFLSGLILFFMLFISSSFISNNLFHIPEMTYLLKIISVSFPFLAIQKSVFGILNGKRKMKNFAFLNGVQNILMVMFSIIFVFIFKYGIIGAINGITVSTIFTAIISLFFIDNLFKFNFRVFYQVSKILVSFGFYAVLISSIDVVSTHMDSLMIGYFMNKTEVGYYSIATTLVQSITLIPNAVGRVTLPAISNYYSKKDYKSIITLIKSVMSKTFMISILILVFFILFGNSLIKILFTEEFLPAYTPLLILLGGYSLYAPIISIGGTLASINKINFILKTSLLSIILNIFLNIILIPKFGIIGAATATSLSLIIGGIFEVYFIIISLNYYVGYSYNI